MKMYINMLNGIPEKYIEELSKRLKKSTIIDKLLITLYFMSEMNDEYHELKNIEINLRKIARDSNYSDFQASAIRGPFNRETQNVKSGKIKECDRLSAVTSELNKLGAKIEEKQDGLVIEGVKSFKGNVEVWSHKDHRIAMTLAIASTMCDEEIILKDYECVSKSYPDFFDDFKQLGGTFNECSLGK